MGDDNKTTRERTSRWLMIVLGVLVVGLAGMVGFALLHVQKPLTVDEQALLGRWTSDEPDFKKKYHFKADRTCDTTTGVEGNPPYRWKMDGPFLVVKEHGGTWERLGPIQLEGDQLQLSPNGSMFRRVEEKEADGNE